MEKHNEHKTLNHKSSKEKDQITNGLSGLRVKSEAFKTWWKTTDIV